MKTKHLVLGIAALLVIAGVWFGRGAWRAHRQLVTLDVREMPLPQVLRKIERQTWTKIRAEQSLAAARLTLHLADQPLRVVLDRIAEQAGAHWSRVYAVYGSSGALRSLELALGGDGSLKPAGWTQLAPKLPDRTSLAQPPDAPPDGAGAGNARPMAFGGGPRGPGDGSPGTGSPGDGSVVVFGSSNGQTEVWSPEELVMQSALVPRLNHDQNQTATPASAAATAREVKGRWTVYYAFTKSVMGLGMMRPPPGGKGPPPPGEGRPDRGFPDAAALEQQMQYDRFTQLTPEQRVERARERGRMGHVHFQFRGFRLPKQ
jgi:hypothetical protein